MIARSFLVLYLTGARGDDQDVGLDFNKKKLQPNFFAQLNICGSKPKKAEQFTRNLFNLVSELFVKIKS